jgi:LysR family transcriptional regulator, carnitine catabolism transcriptional activator
MSVNLQHLKAFVTVARLNSFVQAARALHVSQPALTVQIRQLEDTLGVRLLDRNTRSVRPTQIGHELAPVAERILLDVESLVDSTRQLSDKQRGLVSVAALPSVSATFLPRVIAEFKRRHPGVSVVLRDAVGQKVVSMVKAQEVDFGVGSFNEPDPAIRFTALFADRMSVVFPPGSPLESKKRHWARDLSDCPLILTSKDSSVRALADRAFRDAGIFATPAYEVTYMSTAAGLVRSGLGVAILPTSAVEMGELAGLRSRPLRDPSLTRDIGVIQRHGRSLSPAAEEFVSLMTAHSTVRRRSGTRSRHEPAGGAEPDSRWRARRRNGV